MIVEAKIVYRMLDQRLTRLFNADARALLDGRLLGLERRRCGLPRMAISRKSTIPRHWVRH